MEESLFRGSLLLLIEAIIFPLSDLLQPGIRGHYCAGAPKNVICESSKMVLLAAEKVSSRVLVP